MNVNELPAMLRKVGIATDEQATELLRLIQAEEQATLNEQYAGLAVAPPEPRTG